VTEAQKRIHEKLKARNAKIRAEGAAAAIMQARQRRAERAQGAPGTPQGAPTPAWMRMGSPPTPPRSQGGGGGAGHSALPPADRPPQNTSPDSLHDYRIHLNNSSAVTRERLHNIYRIVTGRDPPSSRLTEKMRYKLVEDIIRTLSPANLAGVD
jgi:hypothetical protein